MPREQKLKVGALWEKTSAAGNKFVHGVIEYEGIKLSFVGWTNKEPKSVKSPQFLLFESDPLPARTEAKEAPATPVAKPAKKAKVATVPTPSPAAVSATQEEPPI